MSIFKDSNDRLFMRVKPYDGKYSVKCSGFFEIIAKLQNEKMPSDWVYRPLNSEIEITNRCNQSCPHCGMAANHMHFQEYSEEKLLQYVIELHSNGIPGFSITGGEPFIAFEKMCRLMSYAKGKVDICKITTNGFWGFDAERYFNAMEINGLLSNRYFVPCLMVSIGEQSTPMKDTCHIFKYAIDHYSDHELTLCISSLSEYGKVSRISEFVEIYHNLYGEIPQGRIYLTQNYYRNGGYTKAEAPKINRFVTNYMSGPVRCFEPTIGKYVLPRLLVKATGDICTCACFNPPQDLMIGNFRQQSLTEILSQINQNPFVRLIAANGLHGFRNLLPEEDFESVHCSNECDACRHLITCYHKRYDN